MTGKDLTKDEPLAQVLIRLGFAAHKRLQRGTQTLSSCNRRIRDAFQAHKFKELTISPSMFKPDETGAFLENLKHWGYQENTDWTDNNGTITFDTLNTVKSAFAQYS
ncbi:hypothetical protein QOT17_000898 [Balamuthia mandrillaris]